MTLEDRQTDIDPEARKNAAAAIVSPVRSVPAPTIPAPAAAEFEVPAPTMPSVSSPPASTGELDQCAIGSLIVGRYLIEKKLGQGGMGAVYLGRDRRLMDKRVVVKVLLGEFVGDEWVIRKFLQEKEALTRANHPGIVGILDAGELTDGKPFLVMEYIDGVTLHNAIPPGGMNLKRAGNLIKQIGSALAAAHRNGIYHRDLKPENIMLQCLSGGEEQVRIIDFGIAKVHDSLISEHTVAGRFGTYTYMSPEQFRVEEITAASDVYSMGAIAYEIVTGGAPFNPKNFTHIGNMYSAGVTVLPRELRRELPERGQKLILKALSQRPQDRFQDAAEFGDALAQALIEGRTVRARATSWTGVVKRLQVKASPPQPRSPREISSRESVPQETFPPTSLPQATLAPANSQQPTNRLPASSKVSSKQTSSTQASLSQVSGRSAIFNQKNLLKFGVPVGIVVVAALVVVFAGLIAVSFWGGSRKPLNRTTSESPVASLPGMANTAPTPRSSLTYWVTVLKKNDPGRGPYESSGAETFDNGDQVELSVSVPKAGHLYLLHEGSAGNFVMIYPTFSYRSASLEADRTVTTGKYRLTGKPGTDQIWMIWSAGPLTKLETAKEEAFDSNKGRLPENSASAVREFLLSQPNPETQPAKATDQQKTIFSSNPDLLVQLIKLEHR